MVHKFEPLQNDRLLRAARGMPPSSTTQIPQAKELTSNFRFQARRSTGHQYGSCDKVNFLPRFLHNDSSNIHTLHHQPAATSPNTMTPKAATTSSNAAAPRRSLRPSPSSPSTATPISSTLPSSSATSSSCTKSRTTKSPFRPQPNPPQSSLARRFKLTNPPITVPKQWA